jgi:hypothetical protein
LKSVDLPTLGRPTMATVKGMAYPKRMVRSDVQKKNLPQRR